MGVVAPESEVYALADHVRATIELIESVDGDLHARLRELRERLFALELAEDLAVQAELRSVALELAKGGLGESLTLPQFRERYKVSA